jgi:hypothetical protein
MFLQFYGFEAAKVRIIYHLPFTIYHFFTTDYTDFTDLTAVAGFPICEICVICGKECLLFL